MLGRLAYKNGILQPSSRLLDSDGQQLSQATALHSTFFRLSLEMPGMQDCSSILPQVPQAETAHLLVPPFRSVWSAQTSKGPAGSPRPHQAPDYQSHITVHMRPFNCRCQGLNLV